MWPITDYEARRVSSAFAVFAVPFCESIRWDRSPVEPSNDLIIVESQDGSLGKPEGYIIVDGKIGSGRYTSLDFLSLRQVLAASTVPNQRSVCSHLHTLSFEKGTYIAILKAATDPTTAHTILATEARRFTARLTVIPHPLSLLSLCIGRPIEGMVRCDGSLQLDVCDAMVIWPREIGRREFVFRGGRITIPWERFKQSIEHMIDVYLTRLSADSRLHAWIDSSEDSAEHNLVSDMKQWTTRRRQRRASAIISNATPPPCIVALCERGKTTAWKNSDRYQLAYAINSLAILTGANAHDLAAPFADFMRVNNMGESRVKEFLAQIKPNYTDKRLCRSRASLASGLICPIKDVTMCLKQRKGSIPIDAKTATIADVWAYSDN